MASASLLGEKTHAKYVVRSSFVDATFVLFARKPLVFKASLDVQSAIRLVEVMVPNGRDAPSSHPLFRSSPIRDMFRNIIFLHIPKTGGSSLAPILRRRYKDSQEYYISRDPTIQKSIERLRNSSPEYREGVRCVTGHAPFGLHKSLLGPTEYITLLRDPVERVISHYYYVRRSSEHRCYDQVTSQKMSLYDYVESGITGGELANDMTRMVAGSTGDPNDETLRRAKKHFRAHFGVVGTVERFDETLVLLKKRYGWNQIGYQKRNVTSDRPTKQEIPAKTRRLIEEKNQLDAALYRYAAALLQENLAGVEALEAELRLLRFRCGIRKARNQARDIAGQTWRGAGALVRSVLPRS